MAGHRSWQSVRQAVHMYGKWRYAIAMKELGYRPTWMATRPPFQTWILKS